MALNHGGQKHFSLFCNCFETAHVLTRDPSPMFDLSAIIIIETDVDWKRPNIQSSIWKVCDHSLHRFQAYTRDDFQRLFWSPYSGSVAN